MQFFPGALSLSGETNLVASAAIFRLAQTPPLELGHECVDYCLENISLTDTASAITTRGRVCLKGL